MNTKDYLLCSESFGMVTGSIIASYNFSNQVNSVILNDIYPTGQCYSGTESGNVFFLDKHNLPILKSGAAFPSAFTGSFSGQEYAFILTDLSLTSFGVLMDFSLDNCSAYNSQVLFTNTSGETLESGFLIGVNQANKLFVEYGLGSGKRIHTCDFEIAKNNVIGFSTDSVALTINRYEPLRGVIHENSFDLENYSPSDRLFFFKSLGGYSGFSGNANQIFLSNSSDNIIEKAFYECSFCSGMNTGVDLTPIFFTGIDPSTYYGEDVFENQVVGYQYLPYYDPVFKSYVSGSFEITGLVSAAPNITGTEIVSLIGYASSGFSIPLFNQKKIIDYTDSISINFIRPLESGDLLTVYDYISINDLINVDGDPDLDRHIALFNNGMLLISGLDYSKSGGALTPPFEEGDKFVFNYIDRKIEHLLYSGLYDSYKQLTGIGLGTGYYPVKSQFFESGDGNITITGLESLFYTGFSLTGYDLFMNGQKLRTGIDYETGNYGGFESVIIYAPIFNDSQLSITTGTSGELISVDNQTESVLAFCPTQPGEIYKKTEFLQSSVASYAISGVNEELWLNGIKLVNNIDYSKVYPCSSYTYNFNVEDLPYIFCNGEDAFFNIS